MKQTKFNHKIFSAFLVLFMPLFVFAQEPPFSDIGKYFSKKEKEIFENAWKYQSTFYKQIFPDIIVDFSEIKISVVTDVKNFGNVIMQKKASGYYSSLKRKLVILKTEKNKQTFMKTTFHELSHALQHLYSGDRYDQNPPWLNEGLAVYLAGMTYHSKKTIHKKDNYLIDRVKTLIELRDLDLVNFVNWDHPKFTKESFSQDAYGYAVGYCIVLFLMNNDEKDVFSLFRSLIENRDKPSTEIFDKYYEGGFLQFEKDFVKNYLK